VTAVLYRKVILRGKSLNQDIPLEHKVWMWHYLVHVECLIKSLHPRDLANPSARHVLMSTLTVAIDLLPNYALWAALVDAPRPSKRNVLFAKPAPAMADPAVARLGAHLERLKSQYEA
jgi:hypothetical protein